jgi:hypothetical protein
MKDQFERILYLQISESMVDLVLISRPGPLGEVEEYRYPKAGTLLKYDIQNCHTYIYILNDDWKFN